MGSLSSMGSKGMVKDHAWKLGNVPLNQKWDCGPKHKEMQFKLELRTKGEGPKNIQLLLTDKKSKKRVVKVTLFP